MFLRHIIITQSLHQGPLSVLCDLRVWPNAAPIIASLRPVSPAKIGALPPPPPFPAPPPARFLPVVGPLAECRGAGLTQDGALPCTGFPQRHASEGLPVSSRLDGPSLLRADIAPSERTPAYLPIHLPKGILVVFKFSNLSPNSGFTEPPSETESHPCPSP